MLRTDLPEPFQALVDGCRYAVVATVCKNGQPWNTPLAVGFDGEMNMYWASATTSVHSKNIAANQEISVAIFGDRNSRHEGQGLYMLMKAKELRTKSEIEKALRHYDSAFFEQRHPGMTFMGDCPTRLYRAVLVRLWRNRDSLSNGYYIDVRQKLG